MATLLDSYPDRTTSEFYAQRAVAEGWTRPVLQTTIASRLHERTHPALTTFDHAAPRRTRSGPAQLGRFEPATPSPLTPPLP